MTIEKNTFKRISITFLLGVIFAFIFKNNIYASDITFEDINFSFDIINTGNDLGEIYSGLSADLSLEMDFSNVQAVGGKHSLTKEVTMQIQMPTEGEVHFLFKRNNVFPYNGTTLSGISYNYDINGKVDITIPIGEYDSTEKVDLPINLNVNDKIALGTTKNVTLDIPLNFNGLNGTETLSRDFIAVKGVDIANADISDMLIHPGSNFNTEFTLNIKFDASKYGLKNGDLLQVNIPVATLDGSPGFYMALKNAVDSVMNVVDENTQQVIGIATTFTEPYNELFMDVIFTVDDKHFDGEGFIQMNLNAVKIPSTVQPMKDYTFDLYINSILVMTTEKFTSMGTGGSEAPWRNLYKKQHGSLETVLTVTNEDIEQGIYTDWGILINGDDLKRKDENGDYVHHLNPQEYVDNHAYIDDVVEHVKVEDITSDYLSVVEGSIRIVKWLGFSGNASNDNNLLLEISDAKNIADFPTDENDIRLMRAGENLYRMLTWEEFKEIEPVAELKYVYSKTIADRIIGFEIYIPKLNIETLPDGSENKDKIYEFIKSALNHNNVSKGFFTPAYKEGEGYTPFGYYITYRTKVEEYVKTVPGESFAMEITNSSTCSRGEGSEPNTVNEKKIYSYSGTGYQSGAIKLKLTKLDKDNNPIEGVRFLLTDAGKFTIAAETDANGVLEFVGITNQDYVLTEMIDLEEFRPILPIKFNALQSRVGDYIDLTKTNLEDSNSISFDLTTNENKIINNSADTFNLSLVKNDNLDNMLTGAQFTLQKIDGSYTSTVDVSIEAAQASFTGLLEGEYELIETIPPNGYEPQDSIYFTVDSEGNNINCTIDSGGNILLNNLGKENNIYNVITNIKVGGIVGVEPFRLKILKLDEKGVALKDTTFNLTKKDGGYNKTYEVSQDKGTVIFENLEVGEYTLTETITPKGYITIKPIVFTIDDGLNHINCSIDDSGNIIINKLNNTDDGFVKIFNAKEDNDTPYNPGTTESNSNNINKPISFEIEKTEENVYLIIDEEGAPLGRFELPEGEDIDNLTEEEILEQMIPMGEPKLNPKTGDTNGKQGLMLALIVTGMLIVKKNKAGINKVSL